MKVNELIEQLKRAKPDADVCVVGYGENWEDITNISINIGTEVGDNFECVTIESALLN